jgi:DNA replication protein DnaC
MTFGIPSCARHGADSIQTGRCRVCASEAAEKERAASMQAFSEQRLTHFLRLSGVQGRYLASTFENFAVSNHRQEAVLAACRAYLATVQASEGRNLWLLGPPGTGKTHLASALVKDAISTMAKSCTIVTARDLVRRVRQTWSSETGPTEDQVIHDYVSEAMLVIDEVGVGYGTDGELVHLYDVIDGRYRRCAPTVLVSNLNVPMLKESLGERLFDRLQEKATILACDWGSFRSRV